MRYYSIASMKIEDLDKFKSELETVQDMLKTAGFKATYVNRDADDPNHLIVMHECEDLQKAREFYQSQEFKDCALKAGIIGQPNVMFVEEIMRTPELVTT